MAAEAKDLITPALTAIVVGVGTLITQKLNRRHGVTKDASRVSEFGEIRSAIKESHAEIKLEVHELRQTVMIRIDEVEACALDAQREATKALHAAIGVDGKNGTRGDQQKLEARVVELERDRRVGPYDRRTVER